MLRGVIVGFGSIAEGHLHGYRATPGLDVVGVVDVTPARRDVARSVFGLPAFDTLDEALAATAADFVDVCTPPTSHLTSIRLALAAGLPVLCEKPVFVPGDGGFEDILEAIRSGGAFLYPCQNYKFAPVFALVRAILESGRIGRPHYARVDIARHGHARGVEEWFPDWRRAWAVSAGGILRDHGPHAVYLLLSLLGVRPTTVSVLNGRLSDGCGSVPSITSRVDVFGRLFDTADTEDTALMRMRCAGSDAGDGTALEADVTLTWSADYRSSRYLVVGSAGFVSVDNDIVTWAWRGETERERLLSGFDDPSHRTWFANMLAEFRRLVLAGSLGRDEAARLVAESLLTTAVIDAGYASARTLGKWFPVVDPTATMQRQVVSEDPQ